MHTVMMMGISCRCWDAAVSRFSMLLCTCEDNYTSRWLLFSKHLSGSPYSGSHLTSHHNEVMDQTHPCILHAVFLPQTIKFAWSASTSMCLWITAITFGNFSFGHLLSSSSLWWHPSLFNCFIMSFFCFTTKCHSSWWIVCNGILSPNGTGGGGTWRRSYPEDFAIFCSWSITILFVQRNGSPNIMSVHRPGVTTAHTVLKDHESFGS